MILKMLSTDRDFQKRPSQFRRFPTILRRFSNVAEVPEIFQQPLNTIRTTMVDYYYYGRHLKAQTERANKQYITNRK